MNSDLSYKLLKYFSSGVIMFAVFKYVPKEPMADKDILLITVIAILLMAVFENLYLIYFKEQSNEQYNSNKQCGSQCIKPIEHMGSIPPQVNMPPLPPTYTPPPIHTPPDLPIIQDHSLENATNVSNPTISQEEHTMENITKNEDGSYDIKPNKNNNDDVGENPYNYSDYNKLPSNINEGTFEYGYSFLPPKNWYPVPPHPPVCVTEKKCPVCPVYTNGSNVDLKEWDASRRISPPDQTTAKYI